MNAHRGRCAGSGLLDGSWLPRLSSRAPVSEPDLQGYSSMSRSRTGAASPIN